MFGTEHIRSLLIRYYCFIITCFSFKKKSVLQSLNWDTATMTSCGSVFSSAWGSKPPELRLPTLVHHNNGSILGCDRSHSNTDFSLGGRLKSGVLSCSGADLYLTWSQTSTGADFLYKVSYCHCYRSSVFPCKLVCHSVALTQPGSGMWSLPRPSGFNMYAFIILQGVLNRRGKKIKPPNDRYVITAAFVASHLK